MPGDIPFWAEGWNCCRESCGHNALDHHCVPDEADPLRRFKILGCAKCACPAFEIRVENPRTAYRLTGTEF